ncbi:MULTISPECIES: hypothetical protein [unclassified Flavobacterium]|uniref:hypothetical protein n=1 Tax=unclassified Flavobacterium TaxID=196869 RepID=UPI000EAB65F6|nr:MULTISPECIES: hypothetical protein [unclassified Flavobacterium]RKS02003.1 hypothetical protein C8C84_1693 [Flavobacterium sp. 102]
MENENQNKNKEVNNLSGMIFVGFMFVGIAAGLFFHNTAVGTLAGIGVGFIASAMYRSEKNK